MKMEKENAHKDLKELYQVKRSLEFIKNFDADRAWQQLMWKHWRNRVRRMTIRTVSLAASVVLLAGISYFALTRYEQVKENNRMALLKENYPEKGEAKALLQLEDGKKIDLAYYQGVITPFASNVKGEQLIYGELPPMEHVPQNTLIVPRGGEYSVVLSDGTRICLNADSRLYYPAAFVGQSREVILEGEGYFEVAYDAEMPFQVHTTRGTVEVLGTQFNLSAYPDSPMHTELVSGSIRVSTRTSNIICKPGQQVVIGGTDGRIELHEVDAPMWASWPTGVYQFQDIPLHDIAAQLSRWYNVDIRFRQPELEDIRFTGAVVRGEELAFAIDVIERVSAVHFVRKGNTVWVMKKGKAGMLAPAADEEREKM